jgi:probable addiction module antidote protein
MRKETFADWDPAEYIQTKEDVVAHLEGALEENDPEFLLETIGYIVRSKGMAELLREQGLDRKAPPKPFSFRRESGFLAVAKVLDNLGFQLNIQQKKAS